MKYRFTLSLLTALLTIGFNSSNVQAQSAFAGFYGQVSTGYEGNQLGTFSGASIDTPNLNTDTKGSGPSQNFGGAPLVFGAGYYWQVSEKWLIGVGADYSAITQTSSNISQTVSNAMGNTSLVAGETRIGNGETVQLSNRFNLFLTPAYAIDKDKLVYLKAGYSQVTAQYNRSTSFTNTLNGVSSTSPAKPGENPSSNQGGYLVGLGYKQMIMSGLYGFAEGNFMGYSAPSYVQTSAVGATGSKTIVPNFSSLNTYQFLVGVGYAF